MRVHLGAQAGHSLAEKRARFKGGLAIRLLRVLIGLKSSNPPI